MPLSQGGGVEWCSISPQRVVVVVMVHFVAVSVANNMWSYHFAEVFSFYSFLGREKRSATSARQRC